MLELVSQHSTQKGTDWTVIGKELGRAPMNCKSEYRSIQYSKMDQGPFTAEEDVLICQRKEEWGDKGDGLWVALEKEMDRPGGSISKRWLILHDANNTMWTDEMVCTIYYIHYMHVYLRTMKSLFYIVSIGICYYYFPDLHSTYVVHIYSYYKYVMKCT